MVAFHVSINGKTYCESEAITALTMATEEMRRGGCRISLHAAAGESALQWLTADLSIGDEIVIRIVDADDVEDAEPPGCSFCGRDLLDVSSIVLGGTARLCDRCTDAFATALENARELPLGASIRDEPEWMCGFCANKPGNVPGVIVRNGAAVCPECLRVCSEILATSPGGNTPDGA